MHLAPVHPVVDAPCVGCWALGTRACQEKFSSWTDPGNGINPFLIPPAPRRSVAVRIPLALLGAALVIIRVPVLVLLGLLLVIVTSVLSLVSATIACGGRQWWSRM